MRQLQIVVFAVADKYLMPDQRLARARRSLPAEYQFGDAISLQRKNMLDALRDHVASNCKLQYCIRCQVAYSEGLYDKTPA